jgi:hypothetical protein
MVHQMALKKIVCFILTILIQWYEMSKSKKLIASWFATNRQLTLVLGFRGSWIDVNAIEIRFKASILLETVV